MAGRCRCHYAVKQNGKPNIRRRVVNDADPDTQPKSKTWRTLGLATVILSSLHLQFHSITNYVFRIGSYVERHETARDAQRRKRKTKSRRRDSREPRLEIVSRVPPRARNAVGSPGSDAVVPMTHETPASAREREPSDRSRFRPRLRHRTCRDSRESERDFLLTTVVRNLVVYCRKD